MTTEERARELGRKHCKLGRVPYMGMPNEYYEGYSEEIDNQEQPRKAEGQSSTACDDQLLVGE